MFPCAYLNWKILEEIIQYRALNIIFKCIYNDLIQYD